MNLLRILRIAGLAEGCSFLLLLLVAMPLKYWGHNPEPVLVGGWIHGILFIAYNLLATAAWRRFQWPALMWVQAGICSLLPLGTFWFDRKLRD